LEEAKPKIIPPPAGESRALPKYFEHAGALLAGTDDVKIKLESAPVGYKLVIPAPAPAGAASPAAV
jgi:hypothetical protein